MKHKKFIYHSYTIDREGFSFHFSMDEYEFRPYWSFDTSAYDFDENDELLCELVFELGMVELISYWKSACPPLVEVRCGNLDEWQINWWKKLYLNGLGEFFYTNNIIPKKDFMKIVVDSADSKDSTDSKATHPAALSCSRKLSGNLIPVGGGKDSIVTLELLRESMDDNCCYIVGDIKRAYDSAKTAGFSDSRIVQVKRVIDPNLLELNKKGYLNGHTPFSAILAFSSLIFAYISGKKYIVLSNESSANEGNISGEQPATDDFQLTVNHQYSKSIEFERDFREYTRRLCKALPEYFSILRPLNELQITKVFTRFPQYFPVFQSCNAGTKSNIWCNKCAKCLYVYIMLSAFLSDNDLIDIFGADLLDKPELDGIFTALSDPQRSNKPFECVGTREEVNYALSSAIKLRPNKKPYLLSKYKDDIICNDVDLFGNFDNNNFIPQEFLKIFEKTSKLS